MSWRELMGVSTPISSTHAHYPHNTHNDINTGSSADIANYAEADSRLLETLSEVTSGLSISPLEVRDALSADDIEDLRKGVISTDTLSAFARALVQRREMERGIVPPHYTEHATCKHCGPVWLWFSGELQGCPWCWNREEGYPIPRPVPIRCNDCCHYQRTDHPHLGHCGKGEQEDIAGLWDTDWRYCGSYTQ